MRARTHTHTHNSERKETERRKRDKVRARKCCKWLDVMLTLYGFQKEFTYYTLHNHSLVASVIVAIVAKVTLFDV